MQRASRAAVNLDNLTGTGCRKRYVRIALVVIKSLSEADSVTDLNRHARANTGDVGCHGRNGAGSGSVADGLLRLAPDGDIEAFLYSYSHV